MTTLIQCLEAGRGASGGETNDLSGLPCTLRNGVYTGKVHLIQEYLGMLCAVNQTLGTTNGTEIKNVGRLEGGMTGSLGPVFSAEIAPHFYNTLKCVLLSLLLSVIVTRSKVISLFSSRVWQGLR